MLLVIGVHREERHFGEAVAARLPQARFDLLRIEQGLSGRRPGPDELDAYRLRHRALYAQILDHISPAHLVLLDLHTGFDEAGPCADVLCADAELLRCVERRGVPSGPDVDPDTRKIRGVRLVAGQPRVQPCAPARAAPEPAAEDPWPSLRPHIPQAVWCADHYLYIGIEIYLLTPANPTDADIAFGAAVVRAAAECGLGTRATSERPDAG
jgi:hypothetical protein